VLSCDGCGLRNICFPKKNGKKMEKKMEKNEKKMEKNASVKGECEI